MENKHTPGPWDINWSGHPDNGRFQISTQKDHIGELYINEQHEGEDYISKEEAEANARLIAAAPDMLEALKEMIEQFPQRGVITSKREEKAIEKAIYAIDKATNTK